MDSTKALKLQALKSYKRTQFLYNLTVYSLTAFLSTLFYLYLFWFPSMKHVFSIFLPNICSFFLSPKLLFIVGNVIVLFLVGQSKLGLGGGGSQYSSPAAEIYDEYVRFQRSSPSLSERSVRLHEYKKKNKDGKVSDMHTSINRKCIMSTHVPYRKEYEKENETQVKTNNSSGKAAVFKVDPVEGKLGRRGEVKEEEEEDKQEQKLAQVFLAEDELNRRVEEFIARVNRQRRLEERQVLDRW